MSDYHWFLIAATIWHSPNSWLRGIVTDSSSVSGYLGGFDGNFLWNRIGAGKRSFSRPL